MPRSFGDDDPWADEVYAAHAASLEGVGPIFKRWNDLVAFVEQVVLDPDWTEHFDHPPIDVAVEKRSSSARYSLATKHNDTIWIRSGSWNAPIVLHELAHLAVADGGHGAGFVDAHLHLVRRWCGFHAYGSYLAELDLRRVPHR